MHLKFTSDIPQNWPNEFETLKEINHWIDFSPMDFFTFPLT